MSDATGRFTDRVESYVRYRPDYPTAVLGRLEQHGCLPAESVVADVGSGTGIFSRLFLEAGHRVIGIEPNRAMREAGDRFLAENGAAFRSVDGRAEDTSLDDAEVDLVVAAQAYHWFDPQRARAEFLRILRPPGRCALVWNERRTDTPFLEAYEELLVEFGTDYGVVDHRRIDDDAVVEFFGHGDIHCETLGNVQRLDRDALRGRVLSSSYAPGPGRPRHEAMLAALQELFDAHQVDGRVAIDYDVRLYDGMLATAG
ncbi:MAG: class I SAM-dependent methyltransferase [bacterium]|nr:class I SAM-dependent methyltransferase [bacterium]